MMDEIKQKLEGILLDCVEHHGYSDEDEIPVQMTIKEVRELLEFI